MQNRFGNVRDEETGFIPYDSSFGRTMKELFVHNGTLDWPDYNNITLTDVTFLKVC